MSKDVIVTKHATQRTKDRLGLSKKLASDHAEKALKYGLTHSETKAGLKKYVDKVYFQNYGANNIRVYQHHVYVFADTKLITILNLPNNLCGLADKLQKKKEERSHVREIDESVS